MPKATSSKTPFRLSLPSPVPLPHRKSNYRRRSSPVTPCPPPKNPLPGPLHTFASIPGVKKEEIDTPREGNSKMVANFGSSQAAGTDGIPAKLVGVKVETGSHREAPELSADRWTRQGTRLRRAPRRSDNSMARKPTQIAIPSQTEIEQLRARVAVLERSERRLKNQVSKEKELVRDVRAEVDASRTELVRAEEKLDDMEAATIALRRDFNRYRGWWLTENRSLKVILREVPKRKWDAGLQAIASSSRGRFMAFCGEGSN